MTQCRAFHAVEDGGLLRGVVRARVTSRIDARGAKGPDDVMTCAALGGLPRACSRSGFAAVLLAPEEGFQGMNLKCIRVDRSNARRRIDKETHEALRKTLESQREMPLARGGANPCQGFSSPRACCTSWTPGHPAARAWAPVVSGGGHWARGRSPTWKRVCLTTMVPWRCALWDRWRPLLAGGAGRRSGPLLDRRWPGRRGSRASTEAPARTRRRPGRRRRPRPSHG